MADIALADFWGIEKYNSKLEKNLGTSLVMINSQKGRAYFQNIQDKIRAIPMPFETILAGNMALVRPLEAPRVDRDKFFRDVDCVPFTELAERYILHPKLTLRQKIKQGLKKVLSFVRFGKRVIVLTRCHPKAVYQTIRYSGIWNLLHKRGIIFGTNCTTNISRKAKLDIRGLLVIGEKGRFSSSNLESRLCVDEGAVLRVLGNVTFSYGCDIEVFQNIAFEIRVGNIDADRLCYRTRNRGDRLWNSKDTGL